MCLCSTFHIHLQLKQQELRKTLSYLLWSRHFTWHISSWSNKYKSKETMQIPLLFTQFLKGNKLNEMWYMIQITLNASFRQFLKKIFISMCQISGISNRMLHVNCAWESHVNQDSFTFQAQFLKENLKIPLENPCMWVTTLSTIKSEHIHIIQCNMYSSCSARENCKKYGILCENRL